METWPKQCTCVVPPGIMHFCPEHGGMWSYMCGACWDHLRQDEAHKKEAPGAEK